MIKILNEEEKELNIGRKIIKIMSNPKLSLDKWEKVEKLILRFLEDNTIINNDNEAIEAINKLSKERQEVLYQGVQYITAPCSPTFIKDYLIDRVLNDKDFINAQGKESVKSLSDSSTKSSFTIKVDEELFKIDIYNI